MSEPILVTGAAGGAQGSTGRRITSLLLEKGIPVRAFVHKEDARSDGLRKLGAEVVQGDLLDTDSVRASLRGMRRAYFTYPVADGLLEATTIFAMAAREAETELVVNNSQLQGAQSAELSQSAAWAGRSHLRLGRGGSRSSACAAVL
jgi:uncharacterized protein YbjT (DUF2867 family)